MTFKPNYFYNPDGYNIVQLAEREGLKPYLTTGGSRFPENRPILTVIEVEPGVIDAWEDEDIIFGSDEYPRMQGKVDNGKMAHYPASDPYNDGWEYDDGGAVLGVEVLVPSLAKPS